MAIRSAPAPAGNAATDYRGFEFESLDVLELAPWWSFSLPRKKPPRSSLRRRASGQAAPASPCENAAAGREQAQQDVMPSLVAFANAGQSLIVFEEQIDIALHAGNRWLSAGDRGQVIAKAVDADAEIVAAVLERAKHEALDAKQLRICLNPADHQLLAELRPDLVKIGNDGKRIIEVVASAEIARGGCRLETESASSTPPYRLRSMKFAGTYWIMSCKISLLSSLCEYIMRAVSLFSDLI